MYRALKPGGRVAAAVWREIALQPSFAALDAALRECLPADEAEPYGMPFRWPKAADLVAAFNNQGFVGVSVAEVRHPLTFEGGIAQVISTLADRRDGCPTRRRDTRPALERGGTAAHVTGRRRPGPDANGVEPRHGA